MKLDQTLVDYIKAGYFSVNSLLEKGLYKRDFELIDQIIQQYDDEIVVHGSYGSNRDAVSIYDIISANYVPLFEQYLQITEFDDYDFKQLLRHVAGRGNLEMVKLMFNHKQWSLDTDTTWGSEIRGHSESFIRACEENRTQVIEYYLQHPKTSTAAYKDLQGYGLHCIVNKENIYLINKLLDDKNFKFKDKSYDTNGNSNRLYNIIPNITDDKTRNRLYNDPRINITKDNVLKCLREYRFSDSYAQKIAINGLKDGKVTIKDILENDFQRQIFEEPKHGTTREYLLSTNININDFAAGMVSCPFSEFTKKLLTIGQPDLSLLTDHIEEAIKDLNQKEQKEYWTHILSTYDIIPINLLPLIKDNRLNKIAYAIKNKEERIHYIKNPRTRISTEKTNQAKILIQALE
jgi:hypothetical protein